MIELILLIAIPLAMIALTHERIEVLEDVVIDDIAAEFFRNVSKSLGNQ